MIVRRKKGKIEKVTLTVSSEVKEKFDDVGKRISEKGYEIDCESIVLKAIRDCEKVLKSNE